MAKDAATRKREQRERDKLDEQAKFARLHARTIKWDVYKGTDAIMIKAMERAQIEEPEDLIERLVRATERMTDEQLSSFGIK